jgi:hypothetical protein
MQNPINKGDVTAVLTRGYVDWTSLACYSQSSPFASVPINFIPARFDSELHGQSRSQISAAL